MKEKGFTLIELLAVIVILAIIALIATPIILNIINQTKESANERSKEMYLDSVEQAIARKNLTSSFNPSKCTVIENGNLNCDGEELVIEFKGEKPSVGGTIEIKDGKIISNTITFGTGSTEVASTICTLVEGESQQIGSKYECNLDEKRTFYVLENKADSNEITLLMDRNYTDEEVPTTMAWCDQEGPNPSNNACNHDGLDPYVEKIQTKFGSKVTVSFPTKNQIEGAYTGTMPQWIYDYLEGTTNPVPDVFGYWTSTGDSSSSSNAWRVSNFGDVRSSKVSSVRSYGLRPVITVSKSDLS